MLTDETAIYAHPADYLVMPYQNTIHGGVIETLDALISGDVAGGGPSRLANGGPRRGAGRPMIVGQLDLPIRHSLVVKKGTQLGDIKWIRSHEQALGQSAVFLDKHLPGAERQPWPSTAGAALSLLDSPGDAGRGAAICSASAVLDHPDLEVLHEGTQGIDNNYTRFILLSRRPSRSPPSNASSPSEPAIAASTNHRASSRYYLLPHTSPALPRLLRSDAGSSPLRSMHTRPYRPPAPRSTPTSDSQGETAQAPACEKEYPSGRGERFPMMILLEVVAAVQADHLNEGHDGLAEHSGEVAFLGETHPELCPDAA